VSVYTATPALQAPVNDAVGTDVVTVPLYGANNAVVAFLGEWVNPPDGTDDTVTGAGGLVHATVDDALAATDSALDPEAYNKSSIQTNLEQDLDAMQAIVDMTNSEINNNPAAVIKDIARMNKRLGREALGDYSEAD